MARKNALRSIRSGTVINFTSKKQETRIARAVTAAMNTIESEFGFKLCHDVDWKLQDIVNILSDSFPTIDFHCHFKNTSMKPDGGIVSVLSADGHAKHPILISEVKNQGTNDLRAKEGLKKQAKGNAIERLGKNVIGFRTAMSTENIVPFVCFGDGCDFASDSSILDRVSTIAMFGTLNTPRVINEGPDGVFNRGSFYFRHEAWTAEEMEEIVTEIARRSIHYYLAKYGGDHFSQIG